MPYQPMYPMANPQAYQGQRIGIPQYPYQQPIDGLVRVTGMEGAKAYQLPPNSTMPLFDGDEDIFYVKSTDGAGFPTVRAFRFEPIQEQPAQNADYVTRAEFAQFVQQIKEIVNGKQPVPAAADAE